MSGTNRALGVTGVTWVDLNNELGKGEQTLAELVARVAKYHKRRLGVPPNLIQVHPGTIEAPIEIDGIWIDPQRHILKRHYHAVCVDEKSLPTVVVESVDPAEETVLAQLVDEAPL
jgi:hypothetical protein